MSSTRTDSITPRQAVKRFLYDVVDVIEKTYPVWEKRLGSFLEETPMDFEERRTLFEIQPVRHYFFAVVVGMEAAKIRSLFPMEMAEDLLAEINELIDKVSGRTDQLVSDLVFDMIQRLQAIDSDDTKKAHDIAMKRLAELLQLTMSEDTKALTKDIVFRQELGQPLAMSMRHWWNGFKKSRQLADVVPSPGSRTKTPAKSDQDRTFRIATVH